MTSTSVEDTDKITVVFQCYAQSVDMQTSLVNGDRFTDCLEKYSVALNDSILTDIFTLASLDKCGQVVEPSSPGDSKTYIARYQVRPHDVTAVESELL